MKKINPMIAGLILSIMIPVSIVVSISVRDILNRNANSNFGGDSFLTPAEDGNRIQFSKNKDSVEFVATKVSSSVVSIIGKAQNNSSFFYGYGTETSNAGTGVIVSKDGYILTNKHVVENSSEIQVVLNDGTTYEKVKIAAIDPLNDIAYLKIEGVDNLAPAELGDSKTIRIGQDVVAIGNALGQYHGTVTSGIISGVNRSITASGNSLLSKTESLTDMIQTDAAINAGNSGGPLVNAKGQVIGINTAVANANGIGFAIPISATKGILKSLFKYGDSRRAVLGVSYIQITPQLAKEKNLPIKYGAWVYNEKSSPIINGGAGDKAGIKNGDIIVAINDVKIGSAGSVSSLISEYKVGDTVKISIIRDGREINLSARLEAYRPTN